MFWNKKVLPLLLSLYVIKEVRAPEMVSSMWYFNPMRVKSKSERTKIQRSPREPVPISPCTPLMDTRPQPNEKRLLPERFDLKAEIEK